MPGLRVLDKLAVRIGGITSAGFNSRKTNQLIVLIKATRLCEIKNIRYETQIIKIIHHKSHIAGGTNHRFGLYDMVMIKV